jgi:hypothetical protein
MKPETVETETPGRCCLDRLVRQLLAEARDRKRRVRMRLREMRGDWIRYPVRGPVMPNGRSSPQWVFYRNAVRNHKRATAELATLLRVVGHHRKQLTDICMS